MPFLQEQILEELRKYATPSNSLEEFRAWFVPLSMEIEDSGDLGAVALVYQVDGILAEASSAEWSEADLRIELARLVGVSTGEASCDQPSFSAFSFGNHDSDRAEFKLVA